MKFSKKLDNLGTETAFAVSAEAKSWSDQGQRVYPFHLGDINIATPKIIRDATNRFMNDGKNGYCPSEGIIELREALAHDIGSKRGVNYNAENVVIQPGGKPTIWKFLSSVMNRGDEVLYPNPGYPIYESQIRFQGGKPVPYGYIESKNGFEIDIEKLRKSINPKTKVFIYNNYQNPISASSSKEEMESLARLCIENNLWVLSDDAYYEIRYSEEPPLSIANIPGMKERTVILYTFSKRFAMTGWRIGASVGPKELVKQISRLNINDESCTNHFIQCALADIMDKVDEDAKLILAKLRKRRDLCVKALNAIPGISLESPESTFYLYVNVTKPMMNKGYDDLDQFRLESLRNTGVSFCTRNHFGTPQKGESEQYIRLAYSGISRDEIEDGLTLFKDWIEN
tara:strand:+ start:1164 stop:2360 length:1197 start_codon:yes stop_codon:yes gene_type:complete